MSKTKKSDLDDILPEYNFDYSKARLNRFARKEDKDRLTVILEQDVAKFFTTSEAVNKVLRAIIIAMPKNQIENTAHK